LITDWHDWDFRRAEQHYRRALERNPNNARAHRSLAWLLMRLEQPEQALAEARRAVELDPLQAGSVNSLGVIHLFAGQLEQAIRTLNDALALVPDLAPVLSNLTLSYVEAGRYREAIETGERLRALTARDEVGQLSSLGYAYARAGRRADAERILREFDGADGVMWVDRALINLWLGNTDLALDQLEQAVEAREDYVADLAIDPAYRPLRGNPRFEKLLVRVGLKVE
jgi:Flp pilus assembly protein TadD